MFILFFAAFLLIYAGIHAYVFFRFSNLLGIKKTLLFYAVILVFILSFPAISFLEGNIENMAINILYVLSATWLGIVFLLFCSLLVYEVINLFVKTEPRISGLIILVFVFLISIYAEINALSVNLNEIQIPMLNLEKELTVVHLSDMHIGTIHNENYMKKIVEKTNSLKPDIVLITGDLVDGGSHLTDKDFMPLNDINAEVFFSSGNHEEYEGIDKIAEFINKTKVRFLRNEVETYKGVQIIGVDNPSMEKPRKLKDVLSEMKFDKNKPSILMYHTPTELNAASDAGINLQLSGHTHNGQIAPFNLFVIPFYKHINGLHDYKDTKIYITSGAGTWGPPLRLGSKSEIVLIKLMND